MRVSRIDFTLLIGLRNWLIAVKERIMSSPPDSSNRLLPVLLIFWVAVFMLLILVSSVRAQLGYEPDDMATFDWVDIRNSSTVFFLGDDDFATFDVPFEVNFYDQTYDRLRIGSNGLIYFQGNRFGEEFFNLPIPAEIVFDDTAFIAPFWDDLNPEDGGQINVAVRGRAPNRRVIVQYNQIFHYSGSGPISFQVILFEGDTRVLVQYLDVDFDDSELDRGASATVGMQRDVGFGQQYSFNEPALRDRMAILWTLTQDGSGACTASEFEAQNRPGNVQDGDLRTRWTAEGDGQWLQCDIGQEAVINTVSIAWHKGDEREATFDLEVSTDGRNWTRVLRRERSSGSTLQLEDYDFPHLTGRFVRLTGYGNTQNNFNSVTEFAIQSLSASDFNNDAFPANVLDGDFDTRWAAEGLGQWIQYDFGTLTVVHTLTLAFLRGDRRTAFFDVEVSRNGTTWTQVLTDAESSGRTRGLQDFRFNPVRTRFVRVVGNGNSENLFHSLTELGVQSVRATDGQTPEAPGNTRDQDLGTRWSAEGDGQQIQFDLGREERIDRVSIAWYKGNERRASFRLETSIDGYNWTTVLRNGESSGRTLRFEHYDFARVSARYMRFTGFGNTSNNWNSLTEVEIPRR